MGEARKKMGKSEPVGPDSHKKTQIFTTWALRIPLLVSAVVTAAETATKNQKNQDKEENKTVIVAATAHTESHVYTTFLNMSYIIRWI